MIGSVSKKGKATLTSNGLTMTITPHFPYLSQGKLCLLPPFSDKSTFMVSRGNGWTQPPSFECWFMFHVIFSVVFSAFDNQDIYDTAPTKSFVLTWICMF